MPVLETLRALVEVVGELRMEICRYKKDVLDCRSHLGNLLHFVTGVRKLLTLPPRILGQSDGDFGGCRGGLNNVHV